MNQKEESLLKKFYKMNYLINSEKTIYMKFLYHKIPSKKSLDKIHFKSIIKMASTNKIKR